MIQLRQAFELAEQIRDTLAEIRDNMIQLRKLQEGSKDGRQDRRDELPERDE